MAEPPLVLCARSQAWLRYWRSLAWWQGPTSFDPVGEISKPFVTGPNRVSISARRERMRSQEGVEARRIAKKELARRLRSADPGLEVVHPNAAGIDVGNESHYVAVRPDRDPEPVRRFACFTADLLNNSFQPPSDIRVLRTYWR